MATLQGKAIKDTYKDLLQVSSTNNTGVTSNLDTVEDGEGTSSALRISTQAVEVAGDLNVTGTVTGVPHIDYLGNYSSGHSYIVDDVVFYSGSSYICIAPTTGNAPTNTSYWGLLAQKGTDGATGAAGQIGPIGQTGPAGPKGDKGDKGDTGDTGPAGQNGTNGTNGTSPTFSYNSSNKTLTITT